MRGTYTAARKWRLAALGVLALLLAPGTWWRSAVRFPQNPTYAIAPAALPVATGGDPRLQAEAIWELTSNDPLFGGFSAITVLEDGRLEVFSDRGSAIVFAKPGEGRFSPQRRGYRIDHLRPGRGRDPYYPDIESVAQDPETGRMWLGYESANAIRLLDAQARPQRIVQPPAMRDWPDNTGPEAIEWLPGRGLLVLRELTGEGLLFPGDPTLPGEAPARFHFPVPDGFAITDMALLPSGKLLILTRKLVFALPPYASRLFIADVPDAASSEPWHWQEITGFQQMLPRENYEGMTAEENEDGSVTLWLVSDDNQAALQRSLLAKLRWDPAVNSSEDK